MTTSCSQPTSSHYTPQVNGAIHTLVTYANDELRPREPGSLRIVLNCPVGTQVQWQGTQLLESRHIWDIAAHTKR